MKKVAMIMSVVFAMTVASAYTQTQFITPEVTKQLEEIKTSPKITVPSHVTVNILKYKLRKIGICVNVMVMPDGWFNVEFTSSKAWYKALEANIFQRSLDYPCEEIYFQGYQIVPMVDRTPNVDLIKRQLKIELKLHNIEAEISSMSLPTMPSVNSIIVAFYSLDDFAVAASMVLTEDIGIDCGRVYSYEGLPVIPSVVPYK